MGFLEIGTPLTWEESDAALEYVKTHGLLQFLHLWELNKDRFDGRQLRWGEEIEYSLVHIDSDRSHSRIYLGASQNLEELTVREHIRPRPSTQLSSDWHPEFANHMIEAIPSPPYPLNLNSILMLEPSMRLRRAKIQSVLGRGNFVTSQTAFPRFGLHDFATPVKSCNVQNNNSITDSVFVPDDIINPHPRFGTLVKNIRSRRGAKPFILVPVFQDELTGVGSPESDPNEASWSKARSKDDLDRFEVERLAHETINPVQNHIYMDCFAFGMGMSCVQTTFATPDCSTARYLYDQLVVLAPLFLALTASTPVLRGLLAGTDTRWETLEQAVDCRTTKEMETIPKSRYSGVSWYISDSTILKDNLDLYNDSSPPMNESAKQLLVEAGVDEILACHYAHLWMRDPMVIFSEKIELDDTKAVDHFENIQSTNWNSVRFKPPPPTDNNTPSPIGWRVEFRTPEIQLTDFDNAASVAFISVLAQLILTEGLDFYVPMTLNDVNMDRCHQVDAVTTQKFHFREDVGKGAVNRNVTEMTLLEILSGCPRVGFSGLIPLCQTFIRKEVAQGRCGPETAQRFAQYAALMTKRASGELQTCARFLRDFVMRHPGYKHDSVVSQIVSHDMTVLSTNIGFGVWAAHALHGDYVSLIPQTPLPSSCVLPSFSSLVTESFVKFDACPEEQVEAIRLLRRRMIRLNEMQNIYTMPVGVTTRIGANCRSAPSGQTRPDVETYSKCQGMDLFDLTFGELMRSGSQTFMVSSPEKTSKPSERPKTAGVVSSEDFTRAWLSKGFDMVGKGPVKDPRPRSGRPCRAGDKQGCAALLVNCRCSCDTLDQSSTDCPTTECPTTTSAELNCDIGDDLIHELSRSLSLGFDTEEDLEYFQQVYDKSA